MAAIVPRKVFWRVWIVLELLLAASYGLSRIEMGGGDIVIPLLLSTAQTLLVILFFMHVRYSERVVWVFAAIGFLWLLILVDLTLSDYITRGYIWWYTSR